MALARVNIRHSQEDSGGLPAKGKALNDYTWAEISAVSQAGLGAEYWSIGDCKEITLNGKIGTLSLSNLTLCVFILHFNYPMNGVADNNIVWGGFKTTDGIDVALYDSKYGSTSTSGKYFNINHRSTSGSAGSNGDRGTNYGGWKGCDLRYDILGATSTPPSEYNSLKSTANVGYDATAATLTNPVANTLLATIPSDFRNVLRLWHRWIDAVGNSSNVNANIEETVDAVTLLTEFEVFGARNKANQYEQNYQMQMEYYRLGYSRIKYKHNSTSKKSYWWCASPNSNTQTFFCYCRTTGESDSNYAWISYGLAPAFLT